MLNLKLRIRTSTREKMIWTPLLATVASYLLTTIVYRLFLHPLSRFPGPKRAAVSLLYEFYHDAIRGGQYCFKIKEMHDKYGMLARSARFRTRRRSRL